MSSRDTTASSRPRVRPVTWIIAAWMILMIALIVGAWKGSESRFGAIPRITVATGTEHMQVLPNAATDLDGTTYTNPVPAMPLGARQQVSVRLPVELERTTLMVFEMRDGDPIRVARTDG